MSSAETTTVKQTGGMFLLWLCWGAGEGHAVSLSEGCYVCCVSQCEVVRLLCLTVWCVTSAVSHSVVCYVCCVSQFVVLRLLCLTNGSM